jgi:hypothetical protein
MKRENLIEKLGLIMAVSPIAGIIVFLIALIMAHFFRVTSPILDLVGLTGAVIFILPFFLAQFLLPSGLLDRFGIQTDIPFWGKAMIYLLVFPFADVWMIESVNAIFNFLPDYNFAITQENLALAETLYQQRMEKALMILITAYVSMVGAGLLFRSLDRKSQAENA